MIDVCPLSRVRIRRIDGETEWMASALSCTPLTAALLQNRGYNENRMNGARELLRPGPADITFCVSALGDSAAKAAELWNATKGGKVVVYGDYDTDGVCSTVLAVEMALLHSDSVRYYIPHRHRQGYGVHGRVVRGIAQSRCDLLVVVDCGTRDVEALREARKAGIPVIVFDHHVPGESLPEGVVVVNPHVEGDPAMKDLSAAGVIWAWASATGAAPVQWLADRLDLVALAAVADYVPLDGVNRGLVSRGLSKMAAGKRKGLDSLLRTLRVPAGSVDEEDLSMKVIPCINAAGRLGLAEIAVGVLHGEKGFQRKVSELVDLNRKRQRLSADILSDVTPGLCEGRNHVLSDDTWHVGVLSAVASRLCSISGRAVALAAPAGSGVRGTLRVPQGGDALGVLKELSDHLEAWGGHRQAAGFSVSTEQWPEVQCEMEKILSGIEAVEEVMNLVEFDPSRVDDALLRDIRRIGPFGQGNPKPLLYCGRDGEPSFTPLGKDGRHVRVKTRDTEFLAFDGVAVSDAIKSSHGLIYRPRKSWWAGRYRLDFLLEGVVET